MRKSVLGAASLLLMAGSLGFHGCSSDDPEQAAQQAQNEEIGAVGLELVLPDGTQINNLRYTISGGPLSAPRSSDVNLTNSSAARFQVGNLPVGTGYSIALAATTQDGVQCAATAGFDITSNLVNNLSITLVCNEGVVVEVDQRGDLRVNVDVVVVDGQTCPVVTGISSTGAETAVGTNVALQGFVSSATGATTQWSSFGGGTFSAPTALSSNFFCQVGGDHDLRLTVSKPGCESNTQTVVVTCSGPSTTSSDAAYVLPVAAGVTVRSLLTVGDASGVKADGSPYRMVGIPDGMGAYDNDSATFTMLANHEIGAGGGAARAHGGNGTFVSRWRVRKSDLAVLGGEDLIRSVNLWNVGSSSYAPGTNVGMGRFCSADLGAVSAFYHAASNTGFNGQFFTNGEETGNDGRAFAHGLDGQSWELPRLGKASWENIVASPFAQVKTITAGIDDSTPGQVYIYVGNKTNSGSPVDRAGLTNGTLYGVAVTGFATEPQAGGIPSAPFTLASLGNTSSLNGNTIEANSTTLGVTRFNRPEDGAWDPAHPNDFYFVTTNAIAAPSRLWRLRFSDITQPELGGQLEMLLDGTEGQIMLDNIGIDARGHIMLTEDPGNNARIAKVWRYTIATDAFVEVAQHNPAQFTTGAAQFITQDEEASGIVDATNVIGPGYWLYSDQIHAGAAGELVERGQIGVIYDPGTL